MALAISLSEAPAAIVTVTGLRVASAAKLEPCTLPKLIVRLPDPKSVVEAALTGLAMVWPWASAETSSVLVPLPVTVPALTVATWLLAICGAAASVPLVISESSELASDEVMFISVEASEICDVIAEDCVLS